MAEIWNANVEQITTSAIHKCQGIGGKLLNHLIDLAKSTKLDYIKLAVQISNISALSFFLNHGFKIKNYSIEDDFIPEDFDLEQVNFKDTHHREELLGIIEYQLILLL